ncbi:MAG: YbaB/EbfC family nucleoid-associated protein [Candidatus Geothermincolia bacterium]
MSKGKYYPKPKGPKGSPGDMMKQLQKVQLQMAEAQEALGDETVEHAAGGGMVKVVADGHQRIRSISIDPEVLDPEDVGMLEDLILVAVNGAIDASQELANQKMEGLTGGLGGLGGLGIPGM